MKSLIRIGSVLLALLWIIGCASQEPAPEETEETAITTTPVEVEPTPGPLQAAGVARFATADGSTFDPGELVTLTTGGSASGRLVPTSTNPDVTLYMTRDGSVPSSDNNWGGPISPDSPPEITRVLEGTAVYRVVAELDGEYSDPVTLNVVWQHEENPTVPAPRFVVNGREVSRSAELPVSDGSTVAGRLEIECDYLAATLYITRDGSVPSADNYWKTQISDGTYIYSPQETAAQYRVIAIWQGEASPVASLDVTWVSE